MRRSIVRRVLQFIPVLLGITFLAFLLIYLSPSDPVSVRMSAGGISVSPEIMESMRRSMGLDRPLLVQYGDWLWNILHGNMGKSYITDADVLDQILKALPYTLKMAGASLLLTLCISIPVGILTAAMQNSKFDYVVRVMAFVGNALPNFIIALCLMFIFPTVSGGFRCWRRQSLSDLSFLRLRWRWSCRPAISGRFVLPCLTS